MTKSLYKSPIPIPTTWDRDRGTPIPEDRAATPWPTYPHRRVPSRGNASSMHVSPPGHTRVDIGPDWQVDRFSLLFQWFSDVWVRVSGSRRGRRAGRRNGRRRGAACRGGFLRAVQDPLGPARRARRVRCVQRPLHVKVKILPRRLRTHRRGSGFLDGRPRGGHGSGGRLMFLGLC